VASAAGKELWLFGGGEPICSSVEPQKCLPELNQQAAEFFAQTEAIRYKVFHVDAARLQRWQQSELWPDNKQRRRHLQQALLPLLTALLGQPMAEPGWHQHFNHLELTGDEQSLLDDWFEIRPLTQNGTTRTMQVYYAGTAYYVRAMFEAFVASGRERATARTGKAVLRPRLVLITASSYNVFEWVDYYQQLFTAAGAEVVWLPIEPAMTHESACTELDQQRLFWNGQLQRQARYPELAAYQQQFCQQPEKLTELVASAELFFINGGDQSLTMRSLQHANGKWTDVAIKLRQKLAEGIPLGGSSAGTAVQSGRPGSKIPMLSGGSTASALLHGTLAADADRPLCLLFHQCNPVLRKPVLTYKADGGLQSFTLGVLDTHFRERAREGRLMKLLLDSGASTGVGVDEATLLRVNFVTAEQAELSVMGRGGVWIVQTTPSLHSEPHAHGWRLTGMQASRLLAGDTATLRSTSVQIRLNCPETSFYPAQQIDASAFAEKTNWRWLQQGGKVQACQREDQQWRYQQLPLILEVNNASS
jgi:cyanophycinase-like exopeptidase